MIYVLNDPLPPNLRPMAEAPRDGTEVVVFVRGYKLGEWDARRARAVRRWVTDAFIPSEIDETDTGGMNHDSLYDEICLGWLPVDDVDPRMLGE